MLTLAVLSAGYVKVSKGCVGKRPRTWLRLTANGRTAYEAHLDALHDIAHQTPRRSPPPQPTSVENITQDHGQRLPQGRCG